MVHREIMVAHKLLLAAFLTIQTFTNQGKDLTIALSMGNISALMYISKRGGTISTTLS